MRRGPFLPSLSKGSLGYLGLSTAQSPSLQGLLHSIQQSLYGLATGASGNLDSPPHLVGGKETSFCYSPAVLPSTPQGGPLGPLLGWLLSRILTRNLPEIVPSLSGSCPMLPENHICQGGSYLVTAGGVITPSINPFVTATVGGLMDEVTGTCSAGCFGRVQEVWGREAMSGQTENERDLILKDTL